MGSYPPAFRLADSSSAGLRVARYVHAFTVSPVLLTLRLASQLGEADADADALYDIAEVERHHPEEKDDTLLIDRRVLEYAKIKERPVSSTCSSG